VPAPFRYTAPDPAPGIVPRPRLLERLQRRWSIRLVTVVAGPGFGKTSLLVSAMADPHGRSAGDRDVWLSCTPDDADAESLLAGLGGALGLARAADLGAVLRAVWMAAPAQICLVLDDAHEIPPDSTGARLLGELTTELPANGHVLLASRAPPPFPVASLATRSQLERVAEPDLLFDADERTAFAAARHVDPALLESSGGWPALAELTATTAEDLVFEYVWDEVLARLGEARGRHLALAAAVGGVDDELIAAVMPGGPPAAELARGVPLVETSSDGWVTPHPLWRPTLVRLISHAEATGARRRAAEVHRRAGRLDRAATLFAEANDWPELLATIRLAGLDPGAHESAHRFGAWCDLLPERHRSHPAAQLALGIEVLRRVPLDSQPMLQGAADGFAALGDVDAEVATLMPLGLVAWWANDSLTLLTLTERARALAAAGHGPAEAIARVGDAAIAHVLGDPDAVLAALEPIGEREAGALQSPIAWLRHVAHRHRGDLDRAEVALDAVAAGRVGSDAQHEIARQRTAWLRGRVDHVAERTRAVADGYRAAGRTYLAVESTLELAARLAWLGDVTAARPLLAEVGPSLATTPGALAVILRRIAEAATAIDGGDDEAARQLLADEPLAEPGRAESWYWVDRAAVALLHVLLPDQRAGWEREAAAPAHQVGIDLARALEAARAGDTAGVAALVWPDAGRARAHLPARWLAELADAADAAGNPPPDAVVDVVGHRPTRPRRSTVTLRVLGPLEVWRDGERVGHPHLQRRRVRELLALLVTQRSARRELVADTLWPEHHDPRHNLRVTLGYLHDVLEPDRRPGERPAGPLTADQRTIALVAGDRLRCDLWDLAAHLDAAAAAERAGDPQVALDAYDEAIALWHGEPFADLADVGWVAEIQTSVRARFVTAALRAGELHLAGGQLHDASTAAGAALAADRFDERAHRLVIRTHLAHDDRLGARRAVDAALATLDELGVPPSDETLALARLVGGADEAGRTR
jgi:DNA-binding SARP family transcriptional activator